MSKQSLDPTTSLSDNLRQKKTSSQYTTSYCFDNSQQGTFEQQFLLSRLERKDLRDTNGNHIKGTFLNGKMHGLMEVTYEDGTILNAYFHYGHRIIGQIQFKDGKIYQGQFNGSLFHGLGTLILDSGKTIKGKWKEGKPEGVMEVSYPNGQLYYGTLNYKLRKHGYGSILLHNQHQYVGDFNDGEITGYGTYKDQNDNITQGYWLKGLFKGCEVVQIIQNNTNHLPKIKESIHQKIL